MVALESLQNPKGERINFQSFRPPTKLDMSPYGHTLKQSLLGLSCKVFDEAMTCKRLEGGFEVQGFQFDEGVWSKMSDG